MKSAAWDRIVSSAPINKDAAIARDGHGEHYEDKNFIGRRHWKAPPKLRPIPPMAPQLVGLKFGDFTVIGLLDNGNDSANWLVRCVCGDYETRKARAIRNPINTADACSFCQRARKLRETYGRRQFRPLKATPVAEPAE